MGAFTQFEAYKNRPADKLDTCLVMLFLRPAKCLQKSGEISWGRNFVKAKTKESRAGGAIPVSRLQWISLWIVCSFALLWPAIINGGAFWFPDTSRYIRGADAAFVTITGSTSEWSDRIEIPSVAQASEARKDTEVSDEAVLPTDPAPREDKLIIGGRSIYYGLFIYFPMRIFGPWAAIFFQALSISAILTSTLAVITRNLAKNRLLWAGSTASALIVLTPMAFYTCMLMPDIWAGVAVIMIGLIATQRAIMNRNEAVLAWCIAVLAATFHTSNVLLVLGMGTASLILALTWRAKSVGFLAGLTAAIIGLMSSAAFNSAVEMKLGEAPVSPPFLSARLTYSGPGMDFLDHHCPRADPSDRFALCEVRTRLPQPSDTFLWSESPTEGVFQVVPGELQRRIAKEDKLFYLSVVAFDPLKYGKSFVSSTIETISAYDMINFNYHRERREGIAENLPPRIAEQALETKAVANVMPTRFTTMSSIAISVASLLVVILAVWRILVSRRLLGSQIERFGMLLIFGFLLNAVICGAFSKPDARYNMRILWLLPLGSVALLAGRRGDTIAPQNPGLA